MRRLRRAAMPNPRHITHMKVVLLVVCLRCCAGYALAPSHDSCAAHFDLHNWELDLPVEEAGSMKIVKQPALSSFSSQYFQWVGDACEFWSPTNGEVSSHGGGPRAELRQRQDFGFSGSHDMTLVTSVLQVPRDSKKVVVAQIKGVSLNGARSDMLTVNTTMGGSCLITALVQYIDGTLQVQFIDKACNGVVQHLGHYGLAEKISLSLRTIGDEVHITCDKGSASYKYDWVHSSYRCALQAWPHALCPSYKVHCCCMLHLSKCIMCVR